MASATLTPLIASPSDLRRVRRELEMLDDFLHQAALRQGGKGVQMPTASRMLEEIASDNEISLIKKTDRDRLKKFITTLIQKAPVVHVSFASEPSAKALAKLIGWMRQNLHPQIVVSIGVQPSIAAGCVVRTANHQFDFSLRQALDNQTESFVTNLRRGDVEAQAAAAAAAAQPATPATADTGAKS